MANDIDKTSPHYKGEFGSIYEVNQKFPNGGVTGDYVEIDGWAHYWNADRGTWCVNAQRDSYWDELITGIIEKFKLIKGATYMGVANLDSVPAKAIGAKMYYFSTVAGTYKSFGGLVVPQGINVLYSENGSSWVCSTLLEVAQELGVSTRMVVSQKVVNDALDLKANQSSVNEALAKKFDKESVVQESGDSEELVMSQKAVSLSLSVLSNASYRFYNQSQSIVVNKNKDYGCTITITTSLNKGQIGYLSYDNIKDRTIYNKGNEATKTYTLEHNGLLVAKWVDGTLVALTNSEYLASPTDYIVIAYCQGNKLVGILEEVITSDNVDSALKQIEELKSETKDIDNLFHRGIAGEVLFLGRAIGDNITNLSRTVKKGENLCMITTGTNGLYLYDESSEKVGTFNAGVTQYTAEKDIVAFGFGGLIAQDADLRIAIYAVKYKSVFYRINILDDKINKAETGITALSNASYRFYNQSQSIVVNKNKDYGCTITITTSLNKGQIGYLSYDNIKDRTIYNKGNEATKTYTLEHNGLLVAKWVDGTLVALTNSEYLASPTDYIVIAYCQGNKLVGILEEVITSDNVDSALKQIEELKSETKDNNSLPSYYFVDNYIDKKISSINNTIANSSTSFDMFAFYTDIHLGTNVNCKTPMLLKYLYDNTPINKAFFGGDIIDAYGGTSHLLDNIKEYLKLFSKGNAGLDCFNIRGNHDFTIRDSQDASTGDALSNIKTHNILQLSNEWLGNAIYNNDDEGGNYFYVDNPIKRIRYIAIDTTDEVKEGQAWGTLVSVGKTQYQWIVEKAIKPIKDGWNIILLSHIPFLLGTAGISTYNFSQFIKAFNERRSFSFHDIVYNFSDYTSKIVACISGHEHVDFVSYKYGCLQVLVACDARYADYKHSPWMSDAPSRTIGTINEQCFDVFALDLGNSIIKSTRIGAGYDRYMNLTEKTVRIGTSITLNASHVSNPTWDFMDIENITYKESTGSWWTSSKDNVSISNGSVTGLKVGNALVVAIGEDKSKEFFHVVVTE